jgi:hypothetical protein
MLTGCPVTPLPGTAPPPAILIALIPGTMPPPAFPYGLDPIAWAYASSISTSMSTYKELPGHHLRSTLDLVASTPASEYLDSTETPDVELRVTAFCRHNLRDTRPHMHPLYYYFDTPDSDSADNTYDPTRECFNIDGAIASDLEDETAIGGRNTMPPQVEPPAARDEAQFLADQAMQLEQIYELQDRLDEEQENLHLLQQTSSMHAWHTHTVEELEKGLATSIVASSRIRRVNQRSSAEPARMLLQPPCFFVTCPSHRTPRPIRPAMKSVDSSRPPPCSKPRVLPRGDAGLPRSSLRSPPDRKERPRSISSPPPSGTRQPLSVNASSTTTNLEMPVTTSMSAEGVRVVMVQLEATTSIGAGATTARRIEALHPSHQALGSSARPFAKCYFQRSSTPHDSYQV